MCNSITSLASGITERVTAIRHDIHHHPETGYQEHRTAGIIESFLDEHGIAHRRCGGTGIIATIGHGAHTVGLRSELDALPTSDLTGLPYSSSNEGVAHACGHDGHIAILLGTAWVLKQMEADLPGVVKLFWQPAEEGGAGALAMIEDGALEAPTPEAMFALHGWPGLPLGSTAVRFGSAMAATDNFEITVRGKSAHGAMPHAGVDPIAIAARIIDGIQHVRSRMVDPLVPCVITVGTINGGTAVNIIPDEVTLRGTIRTIDPETRHLVPVLMDRMVSHTAKASGGSAAFNIIEGYPPVINDTEATAFARDTLVTLLGREQVIELDRPVMGGEDFAYFLEHVPGSFLRLGVGDRPSLHNSHYDFNDEAIPVGISVMATLATAFLARKEPLNKAELYFSST